MVNCLNGLGHNTVVGGNNQNCNIGSHGTTLTHGSKCGVTGGVKEGNLISVVVNPVSTYMLGDTACLCVCNGGVTNGVEQGCFTVVNVTHNNNNGTSGFEILVTVLRNVHNLFLNGNHNRFLNFGTHFGNNDFGGIIVNNLVNRCHHTQFQKFLNNFGGGFLHGSRKFAHGDLLTHRYGDRCLFNTLKLDSSHFIRLGFTFSTLRTAVILRFLLDFLLFGIIVPHRVGRGNTFILFVIFINVDVGGAGVNMTDFRRSSVGSGSRSFILLFGNKGIGVGGFMLLLWLLFFNFLFRLFFLRFFFFRFILFRSLGFNLFLFRFGFLFLCFFRSLFFGFCFFRFRLLFFRLFTLLGGGSGL